MHDAYLFISLPLLHDYNVKLPSFTFYGGRERRTTILFPLFLNLDKVLWNQLQKNSTLEKLNGVE